MSARSRNRKLLAFDWDDRTLRVVHALVGKRGTTIDRLLSVPIPADVDTSEPEQLGGYIRRVLDQEGIATKRAAVDVPRDQAVLNTLKLPTHAREEVPGMVQIQIAKELPFPLNDAMVDFTIEAPLDDGVSSDVLVAAVRTEVLDHYSAIFASAGLKLDRIGLRPYASKIAVSELLRPAMPDRVLVLDIRPTFIEINVIRHGALAFSRAASVLIPVQDDQPESSTDSSGALSLGDSGAGVSEGIRISADLAAAEDAGGVIPRLVREVVVTIEAYRAGDPGASIDHVVIGGDLGVEEGLADALVERLGVTTELYNPARVFGWDPDEGAGASAFAATLGLVLGDVDAAEYFDFLHPKKSVSVTQQRLRKAPVAAAVAVLFLAAGAVGVYGYTKEDRDRKAELEREIAGYRENLSENRKFIKFVETIKAFDNQHIWVDVLYDIMTSLPSHKELVINRINMNQKDDRVVLKTVAKKRETAGEAIRQLEAFRRDGRTKQRFKVVMGGQSEKKGESYPFVQDLRITILDDEPAKKKRSGH